MAGIDNKLVDYAGAGALYNDLRDRIEANSASVSTLSTTVNGKYTKPDGGIPASDLASGAVPVQDVQINGSSILNNGVANVPFSDATTPGLVRISSGLATASNAGIIINAATSNELKLGTDNYKPVVASRIGAASFYGIAKASGDTTQSSSSNAVGTYTPEAKAAIWNMLGLDGSAFVKSDWELIREDTFTNATEADHIITTDSNGNAFELTDAMLMFETPTQETDASKGYYGIVLFRWGSGSTQYYSPEAGAWTQAANGYAKGATYIVERIDNMRYSYCTSTATTGNAANLKSGFKAGFPTFGTFGYAYEEECRIINEINIRAVTGTGHYKLYGKRKRVALDSPVINVSGTTPTITALAGHRYICGEVSTLSVTLPSSGDVELIFESGSTATVLTLTPPSGVTSVKFPSWFDLTDLEANATYDIIITNGVYGMVTSWT